MKSQPTTKPATPIRLDDLVPRENVKGGGSTKLIFGVGAAEPIRKQKNRN
jgi:hypothetical protein